MIGIVLGNRYEILEEVGKGGMAHVYKARCNLLNRMVAVKVLREDLEADSEFLKRFNVEAQAAASLVHPNIVSIFDFGFDQGYHYIVMEYIEGITLKQYINDKAPLEYKDALGIAYQICDALSAAHEKNIVHRDLKPHNIMITPDRRIKVTDFGIARASDGSTMTADNDILGSVHYISPEQAKGIHVDGKSDLYSLGIVMYEMLTGRVPFESDSPVAVAMKHINDEPVSPREHNIVLSYSIESLLLKAIAKDIKDRYQTAQDMMKDIMKLLENPDAIIEVSSNDEIDTMDSTIKLKVPHSTEPLEKSNIQHMDRDISKEEKTLGKVTKSEGKKIMIWALLTALVIVGSTSLWVTHILYPHAAIFNLFSSDKILAPDFTNMTIEDAEKLAKQHNIKIKIKEEVQDDSVEEGTVISQEPKEGKETADGNVVYLTVSVGSEKIKVNDVKLTKYELARATLEKVGFHVEVEFENDEEVPENYVVSQSPEGGEQAAHGSTVKLVISKGPEESNVVVPTVVGKTLEQAKASLEKEGLTLGDISYEKSVVDKGTVIKQNIAGGETVGRSTPINIVVSNGDTKPSNSDEGSDNLSKDKTLKHTLSTNKEEVVIKVVENDKTIYEGSFKPVDNPDFSFRVSGTGQKTYEIYVDGVFEVAKTINFAE